jgi:hypothetical protein
MSIRTKLVTHEHYLHGAALVMTGVVGCWDTAPCDPGQIVEDDLCIAAPADAASSVMPGDARPSDGHLTDTSSDAASSDSGSASCVGPMGGAACNPGVVTCGGATCAVPSHECCAGSTGDTCVTMGGTCSSGSVQTCDEKSDCTGGNICCLLAISATVSTTTCQPGPTCPSGLASAQVCKTDAECAGGSCSLWNCAGNAAEACQAPNPICTGK